MPDRRRIGCLFLLVLLVGAAWLGWREYQRLVRTSPEIFPWTPLSLNDPIGPFTSENIAALDDDFERCAGLLDAAGAEARRTPPVRSRTAECGYEQALELRPGDDEALRFTPAGLKTACPVAAALLLWQRRVVQPAAVRHLGEDIASVEHFGSFSCRRLYGRSEGPFSEHATANAVDIAAFRTASGRRISVVGDWRDDDPDAAFLREVRDGACKLFATVLSPDYNAAHADHLHFDQARRGTSGWRACR